MFHPYIPVYIVDTLLYTGRVLESQQESLKIITNPWNRHQRLLTRRTVITIKSNENLYESFNSITDMNNMSHLDMEPSGELPYISFLNQRNLGEN